MGYDISFQDLFVTPFEIEELIDLKIEHRVNQHSTCYFKALLPADTKDEYVQTSGAYSDVSVGYVHVGTLEMLFQGTVQDVEVSFEQGAYYLEVYSISYSYMMDLEKKSRTFQNKKMLYSELISQVEADYFETSIMDVVSDGRALDELIVQYEETDWEFLIRMASHFNSVLVDDTLYPKTVFYFGMPQKKPVDLEIFNYKVKKDISKFAKYDKNNVKGISEADFVYYHILTEKPVQIGNRVLFQGKELCVYEVEAKIVKGVLVFEIVLSTDNGIKEMTVLNNKIAGCSLSASVTEIKNDQVKVSIEADLMLGHDPGAPCFFPYSTIYSSADGSGWYCMPEIGDSVRIYFPDGIEDHSYAISSVHEEVDTSTQDGGSAEGGGGYSGQRDDPSVKSLRNQNGKEVRLTPEGVYIITEGTTIALTDAEGVTIVSDQNIEFKSDQSIILNAEENVTIVGTTGIDLSCNETASIKMTDNVEVIGQEVKAN